MCRRTGNYMKVTVITVGKIKEKYLKDAIAEYSKRLSKYCKLEIIEAVSYTHLMIWRKLYRKIRIMRQHTVL